MTGRKKCSNFPLLKLKPQYAGSGKNGLDISLTPCQVSQNCLDCSAAITDAGTRRHGITGIKGSKKNLSGVRACGTVVYIRGEVAKLAVTRSTRNRVTGESRYVGSNPTLSAIFLSDAVRPSPKILEYQGLPGRRHPAPSSPIL